MDEDREDSYFIRNVAEGFGLFIGFALALAFILFMFKLLIWILSWNP